MRGLLAFFACAIAFAAASAQADDDLPARVGRIANVQGTLYHSPDDNAGEWSQIGQNYPVAQGDNLWVDRDGHAEVDYGGGQFRLAGDTNIHVSRLDERQLALFIASGRVIVRIRMLEAEDSVRVDTPITQVALTRPGLYRIDVDPDTGQTTLIVREGEADVATATVTAQVLPGQVAVLTGPGNVTADIRNGGGVDGFDTWSAARDRVYEQPRENAYVSREMVGQADLDSYGAWQTYSDYGAVWFPTVDSQWAPYRFGYWTWLPGWGYTWVDNAPWGYAPFHYGRWAYISGRWGWCPGAFVARPLWAPALVAWYGGGGGIHAGSYRGAVYGWVPLGWREPFVPWWQGCTSRCYARYNRPYAVDVAERPAGQPAHFANWRAPGGVTAVPAATLAGGRPVAINRMPVATNTAFAPTLSTTPPAVPPAPVRPGTLRPGSGAPMPAPGYAARLPVPSGSSAGRTATLPVAPSRGSALPPAGYAGRAPIRIDDGRDVLPPASARTNPPAPNVGSTTIRPIPVPRERSAVPVPPGLVERPRVAPLPAPSIERPARSVPNAPSAPVVPAERSLRPAPMRAPAALPAPVYLPPPFMPALPRVVPAQVPAPAAVALPPAVAPGERGPVRVAPVAPKPAERPN